MQKNRSAAKRFHTLNYIPLDVQRIMNIRGERSRERTIITLLYHQARGALLSDE